IKEAVEASQKPTVSEEKESGEEADSPEGPVGLDIGTSHIIAAENRVNHIHTVKQLNAFFTMPRSKFARIVLDQQDIMYFENDDLFYIIGFSADNFANMFSMSTRRPIKNGLLSPNEKEGLTIVQAVVETLIQKPKKFGEKICVVVPGVPIDGAGPGAVVYHESVLKMFLSQMGYSPLSINEGMAIVLSELATEDYTGIGISMGGGMCNVCLSYLSFPVITFSMQSAGDYIDEMVGAVIAEPATKIKGIKEEELDLSRDPKDNIHTALHIFYDDLVYKLLNNLQRALTSTDNIPKIAKSIPIVLSGGTALPKGLKNRFNKVLDKIDLPVEISDVRLAEDPINTTAKGALIMAMTEAD
ncbi:MAG: hypothetical protein V3V76_03065, partial [Candidatus Adiutricales bacterium]